LETISASGKTRCSDKEKQELHSDAWERFERAVNVEAKSPPPQNGQQKPTKKQKQPRRKAKPL
jgi:hypothetical protein